MEIRFSDYKTAEETAREWGVTKRRVIMCIAEGRLPGAVKAGHMWLIPRETVKPADGRKNKRQDKKDTNAGG